MSDCHSEGPLSLEGRGKGEGETKKPCILCGRSRGKGRSKYCPPCAKEQRKARIRTLNKLYIKRWYCELNDESQHQNRTCLSCGRPFNSTGPGNRRCPRCKRLLEACDYELVPKKIFIRQGVGSRE